MSPTGDKPKPLERLRAIFDFIFGFKNRRGEILNAWLYAIDNFSFSSQEFYALLEQHLNARTIPGMEMSREEYAQGGLISEQQTYLRLMRERLAIVTCAVPFGNIYFFSCRTIYIRALVRLWHLVAAVLFLFVIFNLLIKPLGFGFALIALVGLLFALVGVMRHADLPLLPTSIRYY
jgi:hypothetical protein